MRGSRFLVASGVSFRTVIALLLLVCGQTTMAQQLTTRQLEALSPSAANRAIQHDLLSLFEPVGKVERGMFRHLYGVSLTTRTFGTEYQLVCQRDTVTLWYAPVTDKPAPGADDPVAPYSVTAGASFHIVKLAPRDLENARADVRQAGCAAAGNDKRANWFAAKNARAAVQGALILDAAVAALRQGILRAKPCPNLHNTEVTCETAILAHGDMAKIDGIEQCAANPGMICYRIDLASSTALTVTALVVGDALIPGKVISIAIEEYIVVT